VFSELPQGASFILTFLNFYSFNICLLGAQTGHFPPLLNSFVIDSLYFVLENDVSDFRYMIEQIS